MVLVAVLAFSSVAAAQAGQEFADKEGKFKLTLVGDWKAVSYNDAVGRQKTEFVYRDRSEGLLKISREALTGSIADMIRQEEENLRIYRSGFEGASREPLAVETERIRLSVYSVTVAVARQHFTSSGKNAVGVLKFTGKRLAGRDSHQTDQIVELSPLSVRF